MQEHIQKSTYRLLTGAGGEIMDRVKSRLILKWKSQCFTAYRLS